MSNQEQIVVVPDIGTDDAVRVIEVNIKVGDFVSKEDSLITLESEKASMEIPSPFNGVILAVEAKVGDLIKSGDKILLLQISNNLDNSEVSDVANKTIEPIESIQPKEKVPNTVNIDENATNIINNNISNNIESEQIIAVPDIGTDAAVKVIEINVKIGDKISKEDALITLESEKASMEIPSPFDGVVKEILVKLNDLVKSGDRILVLQTKIEKQQITQNKADVAPTSTVYSKTEQVSTAVGKTIDTNYSSAQSITHPINASNALIYASPSVRRFANELGVDLSKVAGSGRKNRIIKSNVENYVKTTLAKINSTNSMQVNNNFPEIIPLPNVDFAKFGDISIKPLSRVKKISAANLHRNWVVVPHVTQFDEADITDMESFRDKYKSQAEVKGYKLTPLVFLMKAATQALKAMPQFNVSLSNDGLNVVQKHYYHIGVAVDTPEGLVVPVIRDVDQKGLFQLAQELAEVSKKARDGKLLPKDMQGGCFTISSLGGIGGTGFTPIVNLPDVAILGVSKAKVKPVYQNSEFVPRLMLPLSLSYDHRVIDGADGARFITLFSQLLGDISQLLL